MSELLKFESRAAAGEALAEKVAGLLREGIESRGAGSISVCGGTSQNHFFDALSKKDLPWNKVTIFLGDERWVTVDSDDSSEKLVREALLKNNAAAATLVSQAKPAERPDMTLAEGALWATELLKSVPLPFDANIAGMGEDGHTASLFPNHPALSGALDENGAVNVVAVPDSPKPPADRISLSLAAHINARHVMININGDSKLEAYNKAANLEGDASTYPVSALIKNNKTPVTAYWFAA